MTREQLSIEGTEPPRNKHVDEALFAWLNADQKRKEAAADVKRWYAALQMRLVDEKIANYPYIDPDTGKRMSIRPEAEIRLKKKKAPAEKKARGKKAERDDVDRDPKPDNDAQAHPPDLADPFAGTRAKLREEGAIADGRKETRLHASSNEPGKVVTASAGAGFAVGDRVTWSSSASGTTTRKTGAIFVIVPAGVAPASCDERLAVKRFDTANPRDHVSYGVDVDGETYWPLVAKLKRARGKA